MGQPPYCEHCRAMGHYTHECWSRAPDRSAVPDLEWPHAIAMTIARRYWGNPFRHINDAPGIPLHRRYL